MTRRQKLAIPAVLVLALWASAAPCAEVLTAEEKVIVEQQVRDALLAEQIAFQKIGCKEALAFFADGSRYSWSMARQRAGPCLCPATSRESR